MGMSPGIVEVFLFIVLIIYFSIILSAMPFYFFLKHPQDIYIHLGKSLEKILIYVLFVLAVKKSPLLSLPFKMPKATLIP